MSSCNPELVSAFLDGELDKIILSAVTDHLLSCDSCRKLLTSLTQVRDSVSDCFTLRDPETFTLSVMTAIANDRVAVRATAHDEPGWRRLFLGATQNTESGTRLRR